MTLTWLQLKNGTGKVVTSSPSISFLEELGYVEDNSSQNQGRSYASVYNNCTHTEPFTVVSRMALMDYFAKTDLIGETITPVLIMVQEDKPRSTVRI